MSRWTPLLYMGMGMLMFALLIVDSTPAQEPHHKSSRRNKEKERKQRRRDNDQIPATIDPITGKMNLCDSFHHRDLNVYCHCTPTMEPQNATDASCWVFGYSENETALVWASFGTQTKLEHLKINVREDSLHTFVPTKALGLLKGLKTFGMRYATLGMINPYAFANITTLQSLEMSRNHITFLRPRSFAWLPNLTNVNLGENMLQEINREVFVGLPSLKRLYVDRNNITVLHDGAFLHLSKLEELEANDNVIAVLTRESFVGMKLLKRLDLSVNNIRMIGDCTFCELPNLVELDLEENGLQFLSPRAFEGLKNLAMLSVAKNHLQMLYGNILDGLLSLRSVDFRNNFLPTLSYDVIRPIHENLRNITSIISFEDNRFVCDCRLEWIFDFHNDSNDDIRDGLNYIKCVLLDEEPPIYVEPPMPTMPPRTVSPLFLSGNAHDFLRDDDMAMQRHYEMGSQRHDEMGMQHHDDMAMQGHDEMGRQRHDDMARQRSRALAMQRNDELIIQRKSEEALRHKEEMIRKRKEEIALQRQGLLIPQRDEEDDDKPRTRKPDPTLTTPIPPRGAQKHLLDLSPEELPCPAQFRPATTVPDEMVFDEFDNGIMVQRKKKNEGAPGGKQVKAITWLLIGLALLFAILT